MRLYNRSTHGNEWDIKYDLFINYSDTGSVDFIFAYDKNEKVADDDTRTY